jgi:transposase InsO family protein
MRIHTDEHMRVYGIRTIHAQLNREPIRVARCTVERLCAELGVHPVVRGRSHPRTTIPGEEANRPVDLVRAPVRRRSARPAAVTVLSDPHERLRHKSSPVARFA